jgi:hypothetical protein
VPLGNALGKIGVPFSARGGRQMRDDLVGHLRQVAMLAIAESGHDRRGQTACLGGRRPFHDRTQRVDPKFDSLNLPKPA